LADDGPQVAVWILDDDQRSAAKLLFDRFVAAPEAGEFQINERALPPLPMDRPASPQVNMRQLWHTRGLQGLGAVTRVFMGLSVAVSVIILLGRPELVSFLNIEAYEVQNGQIFFLPGFYSVLHGQVWRLVTPIFLHFGFLHILFNMMWFKDLGGAIELRKSSRFLLIFIGVTAALSNAAEFWMTSHPLFGGMSGINYGLLGYIWMKSRFDPSSGFFIDKQAVTMMVIWFFVCLFGLVGNVANVVHGVGFAVGLVWGILDANPREILRKRRWKDQFK
jgi:GlpG protein